MLDDEFTGIPMLGQVRSALVSPTKGTKPAAAGEAWTSRLTEPPTALPATQTSAEDTGADAEGQPASAPRSDYLTAAVQSKPEV